MIPRTIDWYDTGLYLIALIIAIPVHEFAHALSAVNNGDDGPRRANRLSILPWDHFDPFGAFFCFVSSVWGFGLGWGRPVLVNPGVLHNPRWGMCKIAAWGPFSNFLLAVLFAIPIRFGWVLDNPQLLNLLFKFVLVNLGLMLFNLIPIGPLDGAKVVVAFLPDKQAFEFSRFMEQYGMILLLMLITLGGKLIGILVGAPALKLALILMGRGDIAEAVPTDF
jgi:Zn-dependent protease